MHVYVFLFQPILCSVTFLRFNAHACMYICTCDMSTMSCLSTWRNCARIHIYACRSRLEKRTQYTLCKLFFPRWLPRSKCCSSKTWFMCTLCACYLVDCSNGTMDNTAAVILLFRQVTGLAPSNAPLKSRTCDFNISYVQLNILYLQLYFSYVPLSYNLLSHTFHYLITSTFHIYFLLQRTKLWLKSKSVQVNHASCNWLEWPSVLPAGDAV